MATTRERAQAAREAKLDELHKRLTGAVEHLVSGEDWSRALAFAAQFRARSFSNTLLIWDQHQGAYEQGRVPGPFPSYVAGYKQWQTLGRQVEKGQPGYQILAPVTGRFASANPADAESWRRLGKGEKPRAGEVVRSKMVGVRPAYVWDASQTSGDPIPEPPAPNLLEGEAPAGLWDGLSEQVEAAGFAVLRVPHAGMIDGANGMTDYSANTVAVREDMDPAAQVKTLAHDLLTAPTGVWAARRFPDSVIGFSGGYWLRPVAVQDFIWSSVPECGMEPALIIEQFDPPRNLSGGLVSCREIAPVDELHFHSTIRRFRQCVIIADTGTSDGTAKTESGKDVDILIRGVIAAPV